MISLKDLFIKWIDKLDNILADSNNKIEAKGGTPADELFNIPNAIDTIQTSTDLETFFNNITDFSEMFKDKNITYAPNMPTSNGIYFAEMFRGCPSLISVGNLNTSNGENFIGMFNNCQSLISIGELDLSNATRDYSLSGIFLGCVSLMNITFKPNSINKTIDFIDCFNLSSVSVQSIIDGLNTVLNPEILSLPTEIKNNLSQEQLNIIQNKNWIID